MMMMMMMMTMMVGKMMEGGETGIERLSWRKDVCDELVREIGNGRRMERVAF